MAAVTFKLEAEVSLPLQQEIGRRLAKIERLLDIGREKPVNSLQARTEAMNLMLEEVMLVPEVQECIKDNLDEAVARIATRCRARVIARCDNLEAEARELKNLVDRATLG